MDQISDLKSNRPHLFTRLLKLLKPKQKDVVHDAREDSDGNFYSRPTALAFLISFYPKSQLKGAQVVVSAKTSFGRSHAHLVSNSRTALTKILSTIDSNKNNRDV